MPLDRLEKRSIPRSVEPGAMFVEVVPAGLFRGKSAERCRMDRPNVVALEVVLDDELPIDGKIDLGFPEAPPGAAKVRLERLGVSPEPLPNRRGRRVERDEDNRTNLLDAEQVETKPPLLERTEARRIGDPPGSPTVVKLPTVVLAAEDRAGATRLGRELREPVGTDIAVGVDPAPRPAQQHGPLDMIERDKTSFGREFLLEGHRPPSRTKDRLEFALVPRGVGVGRRREELRKVGLAHEHFASSGPSDCPVDGRRDECAQATAST